MTSIHLGYEVGTGATVEIPLKHMAVTGMTQDAGKTTTLEALIGRSKLRAVTFITKRGEGSFTEGRRIPPFFRERADWQFVGSLIDATMGEKNKLLRAWLMKVCRNTRTLAEVQANVETARATARGFSESIYTEIAGYLELVVPQLAELPPASRVVIHPGLNVMDLSPYRAELQGLVIRSVIEHVYEHETDVITVIPEAWEFLPEGRGSPVKLAAETLIRKGAALRNYIWVDAQDLGGLWKTVVRACAVYLIGIQREANEVKRTLGNLPASTPHLKAADVASLDLGQFYACHGRHAIKTYVQPAWMDGRSARDHALGALTLQQAVGARVPDRATPKRKAADSFQNSSPRLAGAILKPGGTITTEGWSAPKEEPTVTKDEAARLARENQDLKSQITVGTRENADLRKEIADVRLTLHRMQGGAVETARAKPRDDLRRHDAGASAPAPRRAFTAEESLDNEQLYQAIKARLLDEAPALIRMLLSKPEMEITFTRPVLSFEEHTMKWRLVRLAYEGFFSERKSCGQIRTALKRTGPDANTANIGRAMDDLVKAGVFTDEGSGYLLVTGILMREIA